MCQFLLWGEADIWRVSKEESGRCGRLYPSGTDGVSKEYWGALPDGIFLKTGTSLCSFVPFSSGGIFFRSACSC